MRWKTFSSLVSLDSCSFPSSSLGSISSLLSRRGVFCQIACDSHEWHPARFENNEILNGFRYVDMNHSVFGEHPVLISEASCCIIVVLLDPATGNKFCAHISAGSEQRYRLWRFMKFDLQQYFMSINKDITQAELYLFSNNLYHGKEGTHEQRNLMKLFSSVFSEAQLRQLAQASYFVEGEAGSVWNPFCAIRIGGENAQQMMQVSFAACATSGAVSLN